MLAPRFLLVLFSLFVLTGASYAGSVNVTPSGVAIRGYDPVAYFTVAKAVRGNKQLSYRHRGATYHFSSQKNLDLFSKNPGKYAPQYGGFCAYGVAQGYKVKIEPEQFSVVKGKLYLNYNAGVQRSWKKDVPGYVAKANSNWPKISGN